jgi:plastocyanin
VVSPCLSLAARRAEVSWTKVNRAPTEPVFTGMNRYAFAAGAAALSIALAACGSSETTTPAAPATSDAAKPGPTAGAVVIENFTYAGTMTVKPGEKVTVTNKDAAPHTLTDKATKLFDTGKIEGSGGTGTFTAPAKAGTYPFGCTFHAQMAGTLVVAG